RGLADEHEEGRLESVLGLVAVTQDAAAGGEDHGGVAPDEQLEGGLVAAADEGVEQLRVGQGGGLLAGHGPAPVGGDGLERPAGHHGSPSRASTGTETGRGSRLP